MNSFHLRRSVLAMAVLAAISLTSVDAQTVTTPPRTITSQQETTGNDSTFQGDVVPNAQTSTFQMSITTPAAPTPPTPTCAPSSSSKTLTQTLTPTVYQTAACPAGYLTTSYSTTFTQAAIQTDNQVATQTTTTTCPAGIYGSPSTSTTTGGWTTTSSSTGAWSPTAASACTARTAYQLPINGGNYNVQAVDSDAGSTWGGVGQFIVTLASNGTYSVVSYIAGSSGSPGVGTLTLASGTWLPTGRAASDFTLSAVLSPTSASAGSNAYAGAATTTTSCNQDPRTLTSTVSTSNSGSSGVVICGVAGGAVLMRNDPGGTTTTSSIYGNVTITIRDNRYGPSAATTFSFGVVHRP